MENNCYKIISVQAIESKLNSEGKTLEDFDFYLKTNLCFIYTINGKEKLLAPNHRLEDQKGLWLKDSKCLEELIANDYFPIENETLSFFEIHEKIFDKIDSIGQIIKELNDDFNLENNELTEEYLQALLDEFYKRQPLTLDQIGRFIVTYGILVGELVKKEDSRWI